MRFSACVLAGLLLPCLVRAGAIPKPVLPAGVGVNIHFTTGHSRDLDLIADAGFKFVRMDFGWASIERRPDHYDWGAYDELLANLDRRGLRAILILDYSNPLYEPTVTSGNPINGQSHQTTASPQHPESVAAFARWAAAAAKHYRGRQVLWEIWNEPNIQFWSPKPDAHQYTALALTTCKAIRSAEPKATIIGPASSGFPWEFLETVLQSGVLEYLDAVSVHPYRAYSKPPETAASDYHRLQGIIDRYAPPSRRGKIPILSGEWGYASHTKGVSLQTQAAFAVRQQLCNLLNGVPLSIWYDWKNDGDNPEEREENFGTVRQDLQPKPAYLALRTLTHELGGYHIVRRLELASAEDYVLVCAGAKQQQKLVAWTLGATHSVRLPLVLQRRAHPLAVTGDGQPFAPKIESGQLLMELAAAPQYVQIR
jgi:hypothetical protein